jgi:hypothetical protein
MPAMAAPSDRLSEQTVSVGAYLVSSAEDLDWVKRHMDSSARIVAHDAVTAVQFGLPYFFPESTGDPLRAREVKFLVQHWYRDASGRDLYAQDGVSFAQVISGSLWIAVASLYREAAALQDCIAEHGKVAVSLREVSRFKSVADIYGNQVTYYDPGHKQRCLIETCNDRKLQADGYPLHFQKKALIARALAALRQWLGAKRDTLYINDWTFRDLVAADHSGLTLFGRSVNRGAFPLITGDRVAAAEEAYDAQRVDRITVDVLAEVLARTGVEWPPVLLALVETEIRTRYRDLRTYLVRCHALFTDLFDTYRPCRIVLSGESLEPHTLLMQMARTRSIDVWFLNDGYLPTVPIGVPPSLRREDGKEWLISRILAYGRSSAEQLQIGGFPGEHISLIRAAFLSKAGSSAADAVVWDATIVTWVPNHLNPESREEWTCRMTCEVADLLLSLGYSRIAVKVKHPPEREVYRELQRRGMLSSMVAIMWEPFQQHLAATPLVVGGLSTGVLEAFNANVPYYIYEPFENGYSEDCIRSRVIDPYLVARTLPELRTNIVGRKQAVVRTREELFGDIVDMPWTTSKVRVGESND